MEEKKAKKTVLDPEKHNLDLELSIDRHILDMKRKEMAIFEEDMKLKNLRKEEILIKRRVKAHQDELHNLKLLVDKLERDRV